MSFHISLTNFSLSVIKEMIVLNKFFISLGVLLICFGAVKLVIYLSHNDYVYDDFYYYYDAEDYYNEHHDD